MPMRRVGGWVAGVLVAGLLVGACVLAERSARAADDDPPEVSAEALDDPAEQGSILEMLDPEEREALERSQITGMRPEHPKPAAEKSKSESEGFGDTVGKVGVSIASVALSVAAVVAPFFLF
jgi:hypothetical protein